MDTSKGSNYSVIQHAAPTHKHNIEGKSDISKPSYTRDQQSSKNLGAAPKSQENKG